MEDITTVITNTINELFYTLFSSIDNSIYSTLDDLVFINIDIIKNSSFQQLLGESSYNNLLLIANSLIIGFFLYYSCKLLVSNLIFLQIEKPIQFLFKLIIYTILINFSYFLCEQILNINFLISSSICEIGSNIFNTNISFSNLINNLNNIISIEDTSFSILSIDGIIKSFISIGLFNLIFSYSLRFIMIQVLVLISPFAFITLINNSTSWFFKSWYRSLLSLLLLQSFISIILLVTFSIKYLDTNIISKFLYVGSIYALTKSTTFMKELIGGISTEVVQGLNSFSKILK